MRGSLYFVSLYRQRLAAVVGLVETPATFLFPRVAAPGDSQAFSEPINCPCI